MRFTVGRYSEQSVEFSDPRQTVTEWDIPLMSVRIKVLDEGEKLVANATGFFLENGGKSYLITNWHVVTAYNYPNVKSIKSAMPKSLRVSYKEVARGESGHTRIGNTVEQHIPLFDGLRPLWFQQKSNPEFEKSDLNNLQIPHNLDVIALPVELDAHTRRFLALEKADVTLKIPELGERMVIVGYPHGYSVLDKTPEPIVVTRHLAAKVTERPFTVLADGIGARGMSGSPVYIIEGQHFYLFGIYKGAVIADDEIHESRIHDFYASLGEVERASSAFAFIDELTDF